MIPKVDRTWSSTVNDPQLGPQMIPTKNRNGLDVDRSFWDNITTAYLAFWFLVTRFRFFVTIFSNAQLINIHVNYSRNIKLLFRNKRESVQIGKFGGILTFIYSTALFTNTRTLWSSKAAFRIAFFAVVNHNYVHKQRTLKAHKSYAYQSPLITDHKPWPFESV